MRRRAPRPLALPLERLAARWAPPSLLAAAQRAWPEVAGPAIAAQSEPVRAHGGTVVVRCGSSTWANELGLMSADLARRLDAALEQWDVTAIEVIGPAGRRNR